MGGRRMVNYRKIYSEYATCGKCGLHKYCKMDNGRFVCYSCDNGNFNGLKKKPKKNGD